MQKRSILHQTLHIYPQIFTLFLYEALAIPYGRLALEPPRDKALDTGDWRQNQNSCKVMYSWTFVMSSKLQLPKVNIKCNVFPTCKRWCEYPVT